ncbi:unnamed protein product [Haemonchus placei]|uniref:HTH_48 domain-containing protein n=1 Tax=Haemonchus placei TaxID=6290 RepID=A0A0N4X1S3_HAEPC|nr:unnamed protein product [Haemonchus placei]
MFSCATVAVRTRKSRKYSELTRFLYFLHKSVQSEVFQELQISFRTARQASQEDFVKFRKPRLRIAPCSRAPSQLLTECARGARLCKLISHQEKSARDTLWSASDTRLHQMHRGLDWMYVRFLSHFNVRIN